MAQKRIRIATRQSPLALWQACYVRDRLLITQPDLRIELIPLITRGDIILDSPLSKIGGKGLFVKELELALLENRADIAVHSMKDVPNTFPDGLGLTTVCQRDDPRDAFVSKHYDSIATLPAGSIVGTSSLRRQCQLRHARPDLIIRELRGNLGTRLNKLDQDHYDAIILAVAGLKRLNLDTRISSILSLEASLPAAGQGAIGIECRLNDRQIQKWLAPLHDYSTFIQVQAERALTIRLEGGCQVPIGSHAKFIQDRLQLSALVGTADGSQIIRGERIGLPAQAEQIGIALAEELLQNGANDILRPFLKRTSPT